LNFTLRIAITLAYKILTHYEGAAYCI